MNNVNLTYKNNLCCSCGICEGICSSNAINYSIDEKGFFKPNINYEKCNNCGICLKYCPGIQYYNKPKNNNEYCYGYSNDDNLRYNSSSGGIGTELLSYMIEKKIIDFCVVVKNVKKIGEVDVVITNNINEIRSNSSSKYCPVPLGKIIKNIKNSDKKFAIIGLPCQISSIKKYFNDNYNENIKFYISLFCNHVPSYNASMFLLKNINIQKYDKFLYRGEGWPGKFQIYTENKKYLLPYRKTFATGFGRYFKNNRCDICNDPFGEFADVSLGDAYFFNEKEDEKGNTFCIMRNKELVKIINNMNIEQRIAIKNGPDIEKIHKAYKALYNRIELIPEKIYVTKMINKPIPNNYNEKLPTKVSVRKSLGIIKRGKINNLAKYRFLWRYLYIKNKGNELEIIIKEDGRSN